LTGSETVTGSVGTSTPSISAGRIDFTAGTCGNLILSDGTHYPLTEGAGDTAHDISGNGNHGTINNASTGTEGAGFWAGRIDGEENALNNNNGFSKRVFVDVGGNIDLSTPMTNDITSWTLTWRLPTDRPNNGTTFLFGKDTFRNIVLSYINNNLVGFRASDLAYHQFNGAGNSSSVNSLLAGTYVMSADGTNIHLWYNGAYKGYITPATTELRVSLYGLGYGGTSSLGFEGMLADVGGWDTYTSDGTVVIADAKFYHKLDDVTGTTVPDSSDSGNNGVASGLIPLRIPADTSDPTKDVLGDTLTNPAITDGYNGAETELDAYNIAEGDNPSPATNNNPDLDAIEFGTDFAANDAAFMRLKSSTENDRLITFEDDLTGGDETLAQKYTQ